MNVWWFLFKKEFRLMRPFWMITGLGIILIGIIGAYLAAQFHSGVPSLILFMLMFFHSFYLLLYLLISLQTEKSNTPIWMQSPQSGVLLFSVKFAAGFVLMLASLVLTLVFWFWIVNLDIQTGLYRDGRYLQSLLTIEGLIRDHWMLSFIVFAQRGLFLAALGVLIYFIVDLLKYIIKGWRWILGLGLFLIGIFTAIEFSHTELFALMFHWGRLDLSDFSILPSLRPVHGPPVVMIFRSLFPVYTGGIVFKFLFAAVCFFISTWLLDRKVEV